MMITSGERQGREHSASSSRRRIHDLDHLEGALTISNQNRWGTNTPKGFITGQREEKKPCLGEGNVNSVQIRWKGKFREAKEEVKNLQPLIPSGERKRGF